MVTQTQILMPIKIEGFFENNLLPIRLLSQPKIHEKMEEFVKNISENMEK